MEEALCYSGNWKWRWKQKVDGNGDKRYQWFLFLPSAPLLLHGIHYNIWSVNQQYRKHKQLQVQVQCEQTSKYSSRSFAFISKWFIYSSALLLFICLFINPQPKWISYFSTSFNCSLTITCHFNCYQNNYTHELLSPLLLCRFTLDCNCGSFHLHLHFCFRFYWESTLIYKHWWKNLMFIVVSYKLLFSL